MTGQMSDLDATLLRKGAWELETVSGTYWRGDETKPMLQVILSRTARTR
jgi:threonyl-tRNA synthetase